MNEKTDEKTRQSFFVSGAFAELVALPDYFAPTAVRIRSEPLNEREDWREVRQSFLLWEV